MSETIQLSSEGIYIQTKPVFKEGRAPLVTLIDADISADQNHPLVTKIELEILGTQINSVIAESNIVADYNIRAKLDGPDRVGIEIALREWAIRPDNSTRVNLALEDAGCAILFYTYGFGLPHRYMDVLCKILAEGLPFYVYSGITQETVHHNRLDKSFSEINKLVSEEWHDGNIVIPRIIFLQGFDGIFWGYVPPGIKVY